MSIQQDVHVTKRRVPRKRLLHEPLRHLRLVRLVPVREAKAGALRLNGNAERMLAIRADKADVGPRCAEHVLKLVANLKAPVVGCRRGLLLRRNPHASVIGGDRDMDEPVHMRADHAQALRLEAAQNPDLTREVNVVRLALAGRVLEVLQPVAEVREDCLGGLLVLDALHEQRERVHDPVDSARRSAVDIDLADLRVREPEHSCGTLRHVLDDGRKVPVTHCLDELGGIQGCGILHGRLASGASARRVHGDDAILRLRVPLAEPIGELVLLGVEAALAHSLVDMILRLGHRVGRLHDQRAV